MPLAITLNLRMMRTWDRIQDINAMNVYFASFVHTFVFTWFKRRLSFLTQIQDCLEHIVIKCSICQYIASIVIIVTNYIKVSDTIKSLDKTNVLNFDRTITFKQTKYPWNYCSLLGFILSCYVGCEKFMYSHLALLT